MEMSDRRDAAVRRLKERQAFWQGLVVYVVVNAFLVAVWAFTGAGYFWPAWVIAGWGIGVVLHAYRVFVARGITEADIQREMARDAEHDLERHGDQVG